MSDNSVTVNMSDDLRAFMANAKNFPVSKVAQAMDRENEATVGYIQKNKLSQRGPMTLGRISSNLIRSIKHTIATWHGTTVEGAISSNIKYAAIHEFGGRTKPHDIFAKPGKALAFQVGPSGGLQFFTRKSLNKLGRAGKKAALGSMIFRSHVHHPGSNMPARRYIRNSIAERLDNYKTALGNAVLSALGGKNVV